MNDVDIIKVLEEVKKIIQKYEIDLSWSTYRHEKDLVDDLDTYISQLRNNDYSCIKNIKYLFAPTGDLQEISLSSGFSEEYLQLSNVIDKNIK